MLLEDMAMKGLNRQIKLMALVMVYLESCARGNVSIYYAEYCRRRSCSGLHCDSNTKCGTETYGAHWIFIQLPGIIQNLCHENESHQMSHEILVN